MKYPTQMTVVLLLMLIGNSCIAQTLHSYTKYSFNRGNYRFSDYSNRFFCPPGASADFAKTGSPFPNVPFAASELENSNDGTCIDLSKDPGAVALFMQREKHHADQMVVMERQAAATEKLAVQMEAWMKKAEQDLRSAIDAKFKALPTEIVSSQAFTFSLDALREQIMKDVECRRDPVNKCG